MHSSITLFLISLLFSIAPTTAASIWHVSIFEAPAPPPGKGAPIQASALRDPAYLPAQIAGIVAAYVVSVLIIGSALLFVGRRLRRAAQESPRTLAIEMMKPLNTNLPRATDPFGVSPATTNTVQSPSPADHLDMKRGWSKLGKRQSRRASSGMGSQEKGHRRQQPSIQSSVVTFDESVIEDDRERNEKEMERLYAAVMDHDERKAASVDDFGKRQIQHPPELQHLRHSQQTPVSSPDPNSRFPARTLTKSPRASNRPTPLSIHSRTSSRSSFGSFSKARGIKGLPISPPMGSPGVIPDQAYDEHEPLSPRIYTDPGPPPPTPPQKDISHVRADRNGPSDTGDFGHTHRTPRSPTHAIPSYPSIPEAHQPEYQSRDDQGGETHAIGNSGYRSTNDNPKPKRSPAPLALRNQEWSSPSHQPTTRPVQSAPLPLRSMHPTNYNSERAPENIKATILESRAPGHGLRTPRTGVPMTPYSPYMPYTPLTPMTPSRLVTREERKRREKEEGRRVVTVEDAVLEEPDAWGDAYN